MILIYQKCYKNIVNDLIDDNCANVTINNAEPLPKLLFCTSSLHGFTGESFPISFYLGS